MSVASQNQGLIFSYPKP